MQNTLKRIDIRNQPRHIYALIIILLVLILSLLKISGTSLGMYNYLLGKGPDSSLISGEPRAIRSDEWLVISSRTIAQQFTDYSRVNPNIGYGEDVSLEPDVPTRDWFGVFRPENLSFLVAPFDFAFAFRWWIGLALLLIAAYYFSLAFFTKNIVASIFFSLFLAAAPLIQWTFRIFILLPIAYGLFMVIIAYKMTDKKTISLLKKRHPTLQLILLGLGLIYLIVAFTLLLYPPFQIVTALILAGFYIDRVYIRAKKDKLRIKQALKHQLILLPSFIVSIAILALFFVTHHSAIEAVKNTKFPGSRSFETGHFIDYQQLRNLWGGGFVPQILERSAELNKDKYFETTQTGNQSEAAGFVWFLPLFLAILLIVYKYAKEKQPVFMILTSGLLLIILFLPRLRIPILEQVPPDRWNLGILLTSFLIFGLFFEKLRSLKSKRADLMIIAISGAFFVITLLFIYSLYNQFPTLFKGKDIAVLLLLLAFPTLALILKKPLISLGLMAGALALVTYNVNPLYKGTGVATHNELVESISSINKSDPGIWAVTTDRVEFENIPLMAGAETITTGYFYPQSFWTEIKKSQDDYVYNRSAHIKAEVTNKQSGYELVQPNIIQMNLNPCQEDLMNKLKIKYFLDNEDLEPRFGKCLEPVSQISTGKDMNFYIYKTKQ